jgi:hypothetical protein
MAKVSKVSGPFRALWNLLGVLTLLLGLSAAWLIGSQALRSAAAGNLGMGGSVVTSSAAAAAAPSASSASSAGEGLVQALALYCTTSSKQCLMDSVAAGAVGMSAGGVSHLFPRYPLQLMPTCVPAMPCIAHSVSGPTICLHLVMYQKP